MGVAPWVALVVMILAGLWLWAALKVGADADRRAAREMERRTRARIEGLTEGIDPESLPYRPVRYYRVPDPDVLSAMPTGPLVSRGINRMTPPLLWICTTPPVHEYLEKTFLLEPVRDPFPEPWDEW